MKIYDISVTIDKKTVIYPGDEPFKSIQVQHVEKDGWNLSSFSMGSHTGTHVDSKSHIRQNETNILQIPLEKCYGSSLVIDLTEIEFGEGIDASNLENKGIQYEDIVLIKTKNSELMGKPFRNDSIYLRENAAEFLVSKGVKAFAIDYLSVGPKETHEILLLNDIVVFENINLLKIIPGRYTFVGLPMKLDLEGAPARVILIED